MPAVDDNPIAAAARALIALDITRELSMEDYRFTSDALATLYASGTLKSLSPALPLLLRLRGKPFSLERHFAMEPIFSLTPARQTVLKAGRQVSKSTSLAALLCALSATIPYFMSLYVCPRFDQTRRFSSNYMKPFIRESPIGALLVNAGVEQSVLQRSYTNGSTQHFSYAFLDCDRTRGLPSDMNIFDESARYGTLLCTGRGAVAIEDVVPGDLIISFDQNGKQTTDRAVKCSDHGVRGCYRLEFADGSVVELTSDSWVATTDGWRRVETVIREAYAAVVHGGAGAAAAGDYVGRREYGYSPDQEGMPAVQKPAQLDAERVQLSKIPEIIRVRTKASQAQEELRLREMVEYLADVELSGALAYRGLVLPAWTKTGYPPLARPADARGPSLVVPGRREPAEQEDGGVPHRELYPRGSRVDGRIPTREAGAESQGSGHKEAQAPWAILDIDHECGLYVPAYRLDPPVRDVAGHAAQASGASRGGPRGMPLVPRFDHQDMALSVHSPAQALLRQPGVPGETACGYPAAECRESGEQKQVAGSPAGALLGRPRGLESGRPEESQRVRSEEQEAGKRQAQSQEAAGGHRAQEPYLDVSGLWLLASPRRHRSENEVLPDVPQGRNRQDQEGLALEAQALVRITYTGEHRVFDIETEKHHTFFAGGVAVHNCQDIDPDFIPIINETLSASIDYGLRFYSGTPKTLDNTLQRLWEDSSQAEWCVPCAACNHWSIPSADHDILNMIQAPGLSCAKCGRLIDSEQGMWVHARPQLASEFLGIHAPQLIFPMHYAPDAKTGARDKWRELFLAKTQMNKATFLNEKCGESCDIRVNLLTRTDIRKACVLPWNNDLTEAIQKARGYRMINMGVDWGGGGEDEVSYTTVAVTGFMPDGTVDLIYGERLLNAMGHLDEISTIMSYYRSFRAMLLGHDYGGSGDVRETMILQSGFNLRCLFPALYVRTSTGNIVTYNAPTGRISRWYYSVDKARSLSLLCQLIKAGGVRFPRYDSWKGLSEDLMALVEDKHHAAGGADVYLITRKAGRSDDFVHALNYACLSYWHSQQRYPDLAKKLGIRLTKKQVSILHPQNPNFPV